jgi:NAD-dependent SIR2 family protein deacetylase
MGTSLVVFPFAFLVQIVDQNTPMILINNINSIGNRKNSLWLDGNIDDQIKKIMHDLKWEA